jgi:hypothetical protein
LAADRPGTFLPDLARSLNNLADVLRTLERSSEADVARAEAERIRATGK